ncbi:MAG: phosphate signaling complex protein PhoU [Sedimentisphaerales bacterium]|nr:phosphate signaling complex protein PhoU [Sedimentisphaerales bacterium]
MSELQKRLDKLILRMDHMGLRVEQSVNDALQALRDNDVEAGHAIALNDNIIDREEVEIEQECIRLLALYQPAAIDLRTICMIIKVNNDLERIADKACSIARRIKHFNVQNIHFNNYPELVKMADHVVDVLRKTITMLRDADPNFARGIIEFDKHIDQCYKQFVRKIVEREDQRIGGAEVALTLSLMARALERIGDLCTNIAEDIIFLKTGDIIRHYHPENTSSEGSEGEMSD